MKKSKYPGVRNRRVEAVINKMGGMSLVQCYLSGKLVLDWKTWRTIIFIAPHRPGDFRRRLEDAKCFLGSGFTSPERVCSALDKIVATPLGPVDLVRVTGADLGFTKRASLRDICERGKELKLHRCFPSIGPELCLHYTDQPEGDELNIAMEPIIGACVFRIFYAYRTGGRWLSLHCGDANYLFEPRCSWVFRKFIVS